MRHRLSFPKRGDWINSNFIVINSDLSRNDQRVRDSLVSTGTGSGKTLPIAICTLLDDPAKKKLQSLYLLSRDSKKARQLHSNILESVLSLSMKTPHESD